MVISYKYTVGSLCNSPQRMMLLRYLIARQLLATHGEAYIKDLLNTPRRFLVHNDLKRDLESFTVPDVLSVLGDQERYNQIKTSVDEIIAQSNNEQQLTAAITAFVQVGPGEVIILFMDMS